MHDTSLRSNASDWRLPRAAVIARRKNVAGEPVLCSKVGQALFARTRPGVGRGAALYFFPAGTMIARTASITSLGVSYSFRTSACV